MANLWFASAYLGKFWDSTLKQATTTSNHVLQSSWESYHSMVPAALSRRNIPNIYAAL